MKTGRVVISALGAIVILVGIAGCGKRASYVNVFGQYSLHEAHQQYAELFQMDRNEYEQFLTFQNGWWKADIKKMKDMGLEINQLHERYCRSAGIKVPFPVLIDYDLLGDGV